jgi:hypothetical protein
MAETTRSKTTRKAPAKKASTPRPRAPRKTDATIRNLRGTAVHARLRSLTPKDPFRIELKPRGQQGDTTIVPVALQGDYTFVSGIGVLWEIITKAEAAAAQEFYAPVGYLGRNDSVTVIRPEDATILSAPDWDGKGRVPVQRQQQDPRDASRQQQRAAQEAANDGFGTGMHTQDVPGSDAALHAQIKRAQQAGSSAMPDGALTPRVTVERVRGQ